MIGCYILFSNKLNKFYIGVTQEDILSRIEKHNLRTYGKQRFTAISNDWKLFLFIPTNDYAHAIRIERKIKSMKSAKYIHNLVSFPELIQKLVSSTWLSRFPIAIGTGQGVTGSSPVGPQWKSNTYTFSCVGVFCLCRVYARFWGNLIEMMWKVCLNLNE